MTSALTPQRQFLGNLLEQAREFRQDALEDLQDAVASLGPEMFEGADRRLFDAVQQLLDEGRVPTPGAIRTLKLDGFTSEHANAYLDAAGQLGEWKSYTEAVIAQHELTVLSRGFAEALDAVKRGQPEEARHSATLALDEAPSRGSQELEFVSDFTAEVTYGELATPWPRLDDHLGGGLGVEGRSVVSLWLGDSGVGKSTVMQQIVLGWLAQGHHILYCFGEGNKEDITNELTRMHGRIGYEELRYGLENEIPAVLSKRSTAASQLLAMSGKLAVYDEEFDGQKVRELARTYRRNLRRAVEAGEAQPTSRLIVVIDNIDSAVTFDNKRFQREDQAYEYESRRFEQAAKQHGYHLAILSQINDEGRRRNGPPEKSDIARAKVLMNRAAYIVTIHRPISEADRTQVDPKDDGPGRRARTWIAVRKARGGKVGELEFVTDPRTGLWRDPEQAAF